MICNARHSADYSSTSTCTNTVGHPIPIYVVIKSRGMATGTGTATATDAEIVILGMLASGPLSTDDPLWPLLRLSSRVTTNQRTLLCCLLSASLRPNNAGLPLHAQCRRCSRDIPWRSRPVRLQHYRQAVVHVTRLPVGTTRLKLSLTRPLVLPQVHRQMRRQWRRAYGLWDLSLRQ